jgi:hypothetical protein
MFNESDIVKASRILGRSKEAGEQIWLKALKLSNPPSLLKCLKWNELGQLVGLDCA